MNGRVFIERNKFNGLEEAFLLSFAEEFFRRRQTLFRLEVGRSLVNFEVFEGLERLDTEEFLFGHVKIKNYDTED